MAQMTPEIFVGEVLPPERKLDLMRGLPQHIRPETFERNFVNAVMDTPELMELPPDTVFRELSKVTQLGLLLDKSLGEAYLIVGWNGKTRRKEPQLRVGYRGLIKLARQSGEVSMIYAHEVCEFDPFECVLGDQKRLEHRPKVFGNRGPIVGFYAVVKYKNGETDFEPMDIHRVEEIRDRSDGWKAYKEGNIKSTPWATDPVEMAKKTVIRNLVKRIPASPQLMLAIRTEDSADYQSFDALTGPSGSALPPPPPGHTQITHQPSEPAREEQRVDERPKETAKRTTKAKEEKPKEPEISAEDRKFLDDIETEFKRCETMDQLTFAAGNFRPELGNKSKPVNDAAVALWRTYSTAIEEKARLARLKAEADEKDGSAASPAAESSGGPGPEQSEQGPHEGETEEEHRERMQGAYRLGARARSAEDPRTPAGDDSDERAAWARGWDETDARFKAAAEDQAKAEAETSAPAEQSAPDLTPEQEALLDKARQKALGGKRRMNMWFNSLKVEDRDFLRPYDKELVAAAEAADAAKPADA